MLKQHYNSIVIEIDDLPITLNPHKASDYTSIFVCSALFEPLFRVTDSGKVAPLTASEWKVSRDNLVYTIVLRKNLRWSDGEPITADHFVNGIAAAARNLAINRYFSFFKEVWAAKPLHLVIRLEKPIQYVLHILASVNCAPCKTRHFRGNTPTCFNGRFMLKKPVFNDRLICEQNPHYSTLYPTTSVTFLVNRNFRDSIRLFDSGITDVSCNTGFPLSERHRSERRPEFKHSDSPIYCQLEFTGSKNIDLKGRVVRLAIYNGIRRKEIARRLAYGIKPRTEFGPSVYSEFRRKYAPLISNAVKRSPALSGLTTLSLGYNDYYPNRMIAEAIAAQLSKNLKIKVRLKTLSFREQPSAGVDLFLSLRVPSFSHPYSVLEHAVQLLIPIGELKAAAACNAMLSSKYSAGSRRSADLSPLFRVLKSTLPAIPLFNFVSFWFMRRTLKGFRYPKAGSFDFRHIRFKT